VTTYINYTPKPKKEKKKKSCIFETHSKSNNYILWQPLGLSSGIEDKYFFDSWSCSGIQLKEHCLFLCIWS
jgi:hypothetical protein